MVLALSSPARSDSDTESGGKALKLAFKLGPNSRPSGRIRSKTRNMLAAFPGVKSVAHALDGMICKVVLFGVDAVLRRVLMAHVRKKIGYAEIVSVDDFFPTTVRITELQPDEDADLERKRSSGMLTSEEQQEQSENQQEDRPPPGQADSYISRGMSDQMQAAPDHTPELSSSSSCIFWTESLVDMPAHSSISGGACLPEDMMLMEEEGLGGHDQLYDSAVHDLLSGINRIDELKRHYDLRAGEQANRLKKAEDTTIMLRKKVEELEAKLLMANMPERHPMDMVCTSEDRHARTERELALMQEKMDEANRRIEHLEAADSRYQNRIAAAKIENEKAGERACRAVVEGETTSTTRPSPPAPRSTSMSFVPLLLLVLFSQAWRCARKALFFLDVSSYLDYLE